MKIMLLATVYEYGGLSKVIRNIMNNLDRKRFDVVFLVERLASRHCPLREDMKFINMDIKPVRGGIQKLVHMFRHLHRIRKTVIYEKPDLVLGFGFAVNCLYLLAFLWPIRNMPKTVLGEYTEELFVRESARSFKERISNFTYKVIMFLLYRRADAIVSVSESLARHIKRFFLMDNAKVKVIRVPIDITEIRIRSQEGIHEDVNSLPCVGTVSRLSAEKGINYLIEAFSDLVKKTDARLIIIGEGAERENLENMVKDFKIQDKVSFLGWLENPYSYLKKMDVFVLSSLWEGFPNVILESMICGVPVVATRSVGGVEEAIRHEVDGLLVTPKDTHALSDSIYRLLREKELKNRLVTESGKKIEQFDSTKITREYESLILSL